jgi:hypothetical protein
MKTFEDGYQVTPSKRMLIFPFTLMAFQIIAE